MKNLYVYWHGVSSKYDAKDGLIQTKVSKDSDKNDIEIISMTTSTLAHSIVVYENISSAIQQLMV